MYWPLRLQHLMLQDFLRRVSDTLGLRCLHSTLPLMLLGLHNFDLTSAIWIEVIVFTLLFTCDCTLLQSFSTMCVCIPIQGWHLSTETWPSEVGSLQDGIRAHVDYRTWPLETGKPMGRFFSTTSFSKRSFPLFSSELIQKFPLVRPYPFPLLTPRRFDWWDHSKKYKISDN